MTDAEWDSWVVPHASIFGFSGQHDSAMLESWRFVFETAGYSAAELANATQVIASGSLLATKTQSSIPRTRAENLDAIHRVVRQARRERAITNAAQQRGDDYRCHVCGDGRGWVTVPHLRSLIDGQWVSPWYSCAVVCLCGLGDKIQESWKDKKPMKLANYELRNPNWRQQVADRERQQAAEREARQLSDDAQRTAFGASVAKVLARAERPGRGND